MRRAVLPQKSGSPVCCFLQPPGRVTPAPRLGTLKVNFFLTSYGKLSAFIGSAQQFPLTKNTTNKRMRIAQVSPLWKRVELLDKATATLFPITWRESFGLVMIRSMATGTTGFICQSYKEMAAKILSVWVDHQACRADGENKFSITRIVDGYEAIYRKIFAGHFFLNEDNYSAQAVF